tara:strand:+ start:838 stop:1146 length:309 start_codon:yes stop_codon:yes gene_type:complete
MNEKIICDKYEIEELKTEVEMLERHFLRIELDGLKEIIERLERRLEEDKNGFVLALYDYIIDGKYKIPSKKGHLACKSCAFKNKIVAQADDHEERLPGHLVS